MAGTTRNRLTPAVPTPVRVRRDVNSLAANDPILEFYSRAIARMKARPIADPLSWRYQAAIHDYPAVGSTLAERQQQDPFADASDVLPSDADRTRFWGVCQHGGWFFLPWHRIYLHFFEKIVLHHVIELGGPTDWALPYWNYSASATARRFPEAFRQSSGVMADLFVDERDPRANTAPGDFADATDTNIATALAEPSFSGPAGTTRGFGGGETAFHHIGGGGAKGRVESSPHDLMHGRISGPTEPRLPNGRARGFMGNFTRAPLDPIFWIHHCNIDRLWSLWRRTAGHTNPTEAAWRTDVSFSFHDAAGNIVDMTSSQVEETRPAPLAYIYDDEPI